MYDSLNLQDQYGYQADQESWQYFHYNSMHRLIRSCRPRTRSMRPVAVTEDTWEAVAMTLLWQSVGTVAILF